jgi:hypothetical protein
MKIYEELSLEILLFQADDVVRTSRGGVDFGDDDLGWGD